MTKDAVLVYEILKREDGSPRGLGNSVVVSQSEARKLIEAGTHKHSDYPIGDYPADWKRGGTKKKVVEDEEEGLNNGGN